MSIKNIKSGKHRVLVLGSDKKYLTVQFYNGFIFSFKTEHDFSLLDEYMEDAAIDIVVKGRRQNKKITIADDTVLNIINDKTLTRCIETAQCCDKLIKMYQYSENAIFNSICYEAEVRIKDDVADGIFHIRKQIESSNKGIMLISIGGIPMIVEKVDEIEEALITHFYNEFMFEKDCFMKLMSYMDSVAIPFLKEQIKNCNRQINRRLISLSYAKSDSVRRAPKAVTGTVLLTTENPIVVRLDDGRKAKIDTRKMTPEEYWCLLVEKSYGSRCSFWLYDNNKVVPNIKLENSEMPEEARSDMEVIDNYMKELDIIYKNQASKKTEFEKLKSRTMKLSCKERTPEESAEYEEKKELKSRLNKEISNLSSRINELEVVIADLKTGWINKLTRQVS